MQLERDPLFVTELDRAIDNLKRMPNYKNKVWNKVSNIHQRIEEENGNVGVAAGEAFKKRLMQKERHEKKQEEINLENLILETSK